MSDNQTDWIRVPKKDLWLIAGAAHQSALTLGEAGLRGQCIETAKKISELIKTYEDK